MSKSAEEILNTYYQPKNWNYVNKTLVLTAMEEYANQQIKIYSEKVEQTAKDYANSLGCQSDKEQHTTTPWTEWNIRFDAFKAGMQSYASQPEGREETKKALAFMEWAKDSDLFYEFEMMYNKISSDSQTKNK